MKIPRYAFLSLVIGILLLASPFLIHLTASVGEYDPWLDTDDSGVIDMRDIGALARAFATTGDSTKNVTVTNWPTEQTLNASLADHLVVSNEEPPAYFEVNLDGHSKITLALERHTSAGILIVYIHFKVGGVYTPLIYSNNTLAIGRHFLLRDYEVIGPTIGIEITAMGDPITVSLGIYAYD